MFVCFSHVFISCYNTCLTFVVSRALIVVSRALCGFDGITYRHQYRQLNNSVPAT